MARPLLRLLKPADPAEESRPSSSGPPPIDDAQLLAAMQSGDEDAAAELHDRLRPRVDATIRALLRPGHAEHDDLAQQSFVEIVLSLGRYRGECALETWAATVTARTVFKWIRRRTAERKVFADVPEDAPEPRSRRDLVRELETRQLAARVRQHLATLNPVKSEAFLLHDVCGFDAREIAAMSGISETAAQARIGRGRKELHRRLAEDPELAHALLDLEVEP